MSFGMGDWNGDGTLDLLAIAKYITGSKTKELHLLSETSNFKKFILLIKSALHKADGSWIFALGRRNMKSSRLDLFAVKKPRLIVLRPK